MLDIMGIQIIPMITVLIVAICSVRTNFFSGVLGLSFLYISTVNRVEQELNTEARELIKAARRPAATKPLNPEGNRLLINTGKASSGESQCSSPLILRVSAMTPGIKKRNTGISFSKAPKIDR